MKRIMVRENIWRGFLQAGVPFLTVYGLLLVFVTWRIDSAAEVPLLVLLIIGGILGTSTSVFWRACHVIASHVPAGLPRVLQIIKKDPQSKDSPLLVILEPSQLLARNVPVAFFHRDENDIERFVGLGRVFHIQQNGLVQSEILDWKDMPLLKRLRANEAPAIRQLLVKPSIPDEYAEILSKHKEAT